MRCTKCSDTIPEYLMDIAKRSPKTSRRNLFIDTMLLDGKSLIYLRVHGSKFRFNVTGHYPILAGYNAIGEPLYLASVRLGDVWHFTTVTNGASEATVLDELGKERTTQTFFVLALRHDPSDHQQPYPLVRKRAMDPTGPLYWLKFWPEKDPDYKKEIIFRYDGPRESYFFSNKKHSNEALRQFASDRRLVSFIRDLFRRNELECSILSGFE